MTCADTFNFYSVYILVYVSGYSYGHHIHACGGQTRVSELLELSYKSLLTTIWRLETEHMSSARAARALH